MKGIDSRLRAGLLGPLRTLAWTLDHPAPTSCPAPRSFQTLQEARRHSFGSFLECRANFGRVDTGPLLDGLQLHLAQVKSGVAGDVFEVCIGAKQFCSDVETRLGDDTVHSSTDGDSLASQRTE